MEPESSEPESARCDSRHEAAVEVKPRSSEFWLALAGIAAGLLGVLAGGLIGYVQSINQISQETDRAKTAFVREQRKAAYVDYLSTQSDLGHSEMRLTTSLENSLNSKFDIRDLNDAYGAYRTAFLAYNRADDTARLVGSDLVLGIVNSVDEKHNELLAQFTDVMTVASTGSVESRSAAIAALRTKILASPGEPEFVEAARSDLSIPGDG